MTERRASGADAAELFAAGVIVGTRGLRGELRVRPSSGSGSALLDAETVWLAVAGGVPTPFAVVKATANKMLVMLQLATLDHIDKVAGLNGTPVLMRYADLGELPEDSYYWHQLQGLSVVDKQRGEIGSIEDLFSTAAHDIYVVRGRFGEVLIPAVDAFVVEIDEATRRMTVDLPDGLIPGTDAV